jgi:hypothetical protein
MKNICARQTKDDKRCEVNIDTLIERFKKMRALNCTNPYDVGLDGYMWKKFIISTRAHLIAKMF